MRACCLLTAWLILSALCAPAASAPPADPFVLPETPPAEPAAPATTAEPATAALIPLIHANASEIAELLGPGGSAILSGSGRISVDARTNTVVVHDTADRIEAARALIAELDRPVPQILIEARIVLVRGDYAHQLGRRLGVTARSERGAAGARAAPLPGVDGDDGMMVDLPAAEPAGSLGVAVGQVGSSLLQLELSAMEAEGHGQVISTPRVVTTERQEARIEQGVQIPYQQSAESGATTIAFREATLSLTSTPALAGDGQIDLRLRVTKDAVGRTFNGVPSIDTQVLATQLQIRNGETVVLGGVYEQERHEESRRVPWLADLPLIGWLFRGRTERERYSELLVFVTPTLLEEY